MFIEKKGKSLGERFRVQVEELVIFDLDFSFVVCYLRDFDF